jgi:hypothetical protein
MFTEITFELFCIRFAVDARCCLINVNYRLNFWARYTLCTSVEPSFPHHHHHHHHQQHDVRQTCMDQN